MWRFLALVGFILLGSCGNQTTAGGGSDQPNTLDVLVLQENGQPAVGAAARWVSGRWNTEDTSASSASVFGREAKVDSSGRVQLERPDTGVWHLEVIDSLRRQVAILDTIRNNAIHLLPAGEWSGYVASRGALPAEIFLAGTSRSVSIGPNRLFHLGWLPAGQYRVQGKWANVRRELASRYLDVGEIVTGDTLDGDSAEVELVDFDRFPLRSALRGIFWLDTDVNPGQWFQASDASSRITPSDFSSNPASALLEEDGRDYVRVTFRLGSTTQYNGVTTSPWAGIGIGTAPNAYGLDWSGVSAIRILVRGRGVMRMQVNSFAVDSIGSVNHFGSVISLEATWRWYEIPVRDLWSQGTGILWSDAAKGVHAVAFYAMQKDVQVDLADIRVRGVIAARSSFVLPVSIP